MLRTTVFVFTCIGCIASAKAGIIVTLVPDRPGPYSPASSDGLTVQVEVFARLDTPIPDGVPGAPGARLRMAQFDLGASSPALTITPITTHTGIGEEEPFTAIEFWDFSLTSNCINNPAACGLGYFLDGSLSDATPDTLNMTFAQLTSSGVRQLTLTTTDRRMGLLEVTLPPIPGHYFLDVINEQATGDGGAEFRYGFGTATDPSVAFCVTPGPPCEVTVSGGRLPLAVPDPATLVLLGIGGLATAMCRRHKTEAGTR